MGTPNKIVDYYILIHKPSHSRAFETGYVPEQILVAEKQLGRSLYDDEEVKHVNGDCHDNRVSNLEVVSYSSGFRSQRFDVEGETDSKRVASRTFIPCRFQQPCWAKVRLPIIRKTKAYLPYICSYQTEGDIYKCSHFWKFLDKAMEEENKEIEKGV